MSELVGDRIRENPELRALDPRLAGTYRTAHI